MRGKNQRVKKIRRLRKMTLEKCHKNPCIHCPIVERCVQKHGEVVGKIHDESTINEMVLEELAYLYLEIEMMKKMRML